MSILLPLLIFALPAILVVLYSIWAFTRPGWNNMGIEFAAILLLIFGAVWCLVIPPIYYVGRAVDKANCGHDGVQMQRKTKFKQYNAVTWKCLVQTSHGYVDINNLNGFDEAH